MTFTDQRVPPMGSEAEETKFSENIVNNNKPNFPNYDTWKISFQNLLDDPEGYQTYYEFLETEQLTVLFDCWYCCQQYRFYQPNKATAKDVYSRYVRIKDSRVPISDQARNNLAVRLRANDVSETLLNEIENEVFANLRDVQYPKFLKSDFFTFYCESSGQIHYDPSDFHKCKISTLKRGKKGNIVNDADMITCPRLSHDVQHEFQTHHDKSFYPMSSKYHTGELQVISDSHNECDKISMTDSKASGSTGRCSRNPRGYGHDQLQDIPNFQPRTQRISKDRMRPMEPVDFASLLSQKLDNLPLDRQGRALLDRQERSEADKMVQQPISTDAVNLKNVPQSSSSHRRISNHHHHQHYEREYEPSECDAQSYVAPPMSDRYSVAGQSSHSGSHSGVMMNKKAKELRDIVHHQLRNDLGECKCDNCVQQKFHERYYNTSGGGGGSNPNVANRYDKRPNQSSSSYYSHSNHNSHHSSDYHHSHSTLEETRYSSVHNNTEHYGGRRPDYKEDAGNDAYADVMPPLDTSKIYNWMEKNERYNQQTAFANPAPSPQVSRKKKQQVAYDTSRAVQPIAQDPGMPVLTPPDTGNVLEEVKRVLEEPRHHRQHTGTMSSKKSTSGRSRTGAYSHHPHEMYTGSDVYDKNSMVSAPWSVPDSASVISYNPSQISTVPSSASRLWNSQGYFDTGSEVRDDRTSDVRSQSTGRSGPRSAPRSMTRSDHLSNARSEHHSDVRSQSTGRSHGSDNSKGRSKSGTVITFYYGVDPIPFRINIPTAEVTLAQFKAETKKGNYRFFFKTISNVDGEIVYEEVKNDDDILPKFNEKIIGKVEKVE